MNIFLTGERGVGKSTIIKKAMKVLPSFGGFLTRRISGGVKLTNLVTKEEKIVARIVNGEWVSCPEVFDKSGSQAIEMGMEKEFIIMDELGKFEEHARKFQRRVFQAIDCPKPVIGVIRDEYNPFLDRIRKLKSVKIIRVDVKNRDRLVESILESMVNNR